MSSTYTFILESPLTGTDTAESLTWNMDFLPPDHVAGRTCHLQLAVARPIYTVFDADEVAYAWQVEITNLNMPWNMITNSNVEETQLSKVLGFTSPFPYPCGPKVRTYISEGHQQLNFRISNPKAGVATLGKDLMFLVQLIIEPLT